MFFCMWYNVFFNWKLKNIFGVSYLNLGIGFYLVIWFCVCLDYNNFFEKELVKWDRYFLL